MVKKILFLIRRAPPNTGAIKMNEFYYNVIKKDKNYKISAIKLNNYKTISQMGRFNLLTIFNFIKNYLKLLFKLIFDKPDLIYMEVAPSGLALLRDSFYLSLAKLFNVKIVVQFHAKGLSNYINNKIKYNYFKYIFKNVKAIILSPALINEYSKVISKDQIYFLPNGISDDVESNLNKILNNRKKQGKLNILFLSNMLEFKGPIDVLYICKKLQDNNINFTCNFVGDFSSGDFKNKFIKILHESKLEQKCILRGEKHGTAKRKYFENANVFIYPTHNDCFPLVILESFMYGIPVLTYNVGAIKDMVSTDYLGFVAEDNKYIDIYKYLVEHEKEIINLKQATKIRKHFLDNYLSENSEKKFINIISNELKK